MALTHIGKYEIVEKIGLGGFGTIYRGRDPYIKRDVAIKTCNSDEDEIKRRFFKEAEFAGNLQHRNICTIYDFGVEEGIPYIVLEYLSGEDLDKKIKRKDRLPLTTKIDYMIGLCDALAFAHSRGIVHRDIKPSNVRILEDGSLKIMDFGIAKSMHVESNLTQTGMTLGTAAYLAPEQIKGEPVDVRTDIFSTGVLMYELFTYVKPFIGEHISTILYKILNEEPEPITKQWPEFPAPIDAAIQKAMHKNPARRFQRIDELTAELGEIRRALTDSARLSGLPPAAPEQSPFEDSTARRAAESAASNPTTIRPSPFTMQHEPTPAAPWDPAAAAAHAAPAGATAAIPTRTAPPRVDVEIHHAPRPRRRDEGGEPPRRGATVWGMLGGLVVLGALGWLLATQFLGLGSKGKVAAIPSPGVVQTPAPVSTPAPPPETPTPAPSVDPAAETAALVAEGRALAGRGRLTGANGSAHAVLQQLRTRLGDSDPAVAELAQSIGQGLLERARAAGRRNEYDRALSAYAEYAGLELPIVKQDVSRAVGELRTRQDSASRRYSVKLVSLVSGTSVSVDGVPYGEIPPPRTVELQGGSHRFTFTVAGQTETVTRGIDGPETVVNPIKPGGTLVVVAELGSPYGSVAVDGRTVGNTPQRTHVGAGTHEVTVTRDGYAPFSAQVRVEAGGTATVRVRLNKAQ